MKPHIAPPRLPIFIMGPLPKEDPHGTRQHEVLDSSHAT